MLKSLAELVKHTATILKIGVALWVCYLCWQVKVAVEEKVTAIKDKTVEVVEASKELIDKLSTWRLFKEIEEDEKRRFRAINGASAEHELESVEPDSRPE